MWHDAAIVEAHTAATSLGPHVAAPEAAGFVVCHHVQLRKVWLLHDVIQEHRTHLHTQQAGSTAGTVRVSHCLHTQLQQSKQLQHCNNSMLAPLATGNGRTCRSLNPARHALLLTGSSGSLPRSTYMRPFSMSASSSGLSDAQHRSHTSCSPAPFNMAEPDESRNVCGTARPNCMRIKQYASRSAA